MFLLYPKTRSFLAIWIFSSLTVISSLRGREVKRRSQGSLLIHPREHWWLGLFTFSVAGSIGPWLPLIEILGLVPGNTARYAVDSLRWMCAVDIDLAGSP